MTNTNVSDQLIEEFLTTTAGSLGSLREQYFLRETMYSLLRLARSEQLMDIRNSVNRLVPASLRATTPRRSRGKRSTSAGCPTQHPLAFGKQD